MKTSTRHTRFVSSILLALTTGVALAQATGPAAGNAASAAPAFKPSTLVARPIRAGAYWLEGGRANSGFVIGSTGVVVIDTQITPADARTAISEIGKLTAKPVVAVIVSHGDPDHIGGLSAYPDGATVIEHEATVAYVVAAANDAAHGGPAFGPLYQQMAKRQPTRTIGNTETVELGGVRMVLLHVAPAHTAGDLVVYLPAQKTVYCGDVLLTSQRLPVIHLGGSTLGWLATMEAMLALNADRYIAGHGSVETKAQVQARLRDVEQQREQIKAMVRAGKSLAEIETALPEPPSQFLSFAATVYKELTTGYPTPAPPWANLVNR